MPSIYALESFGTLFSISGFSKKSTAIIFTTLTKINCLINHWPSFGADMIMIYLKQFLNDKRKGPSSKYTCRATSKTIHHLVFTFFKSLNERSWIFSLKFNFFLSPNSFSQQTQSLIIFYCYSKKIRMFLSSILDEKYFFFKIKNWSKKFSIKSLPSTLRKIIHEIDLYFDLKKFFLDRIF